MSRMFFCTGDEDQGGLDSTGAKTPRGHGGGMKCVKTFLAVDIPLFDVFILFGDGKGWKAFTRTFTFHFLQKVVEFSSHYFLGIRTSIPSPLTT